jgi:hypothetical protein
MPLGTSSRYLCGACGVEESFSIYHRMKSCIDHLIILLSFFTQPALNLRWKVCSQPSEEDLEDKIPLSYVLTSSNSTPVAVQRRMDGSLTWMDNVALQPSEPPAIGVIDATTPVSLFFAKRETASAIVLPTGKEVERRPPRTRQTLAEF